ncbi:hypothetical protein [Empedobacter tilapiae]|uniref:Uncharacterized protein n=1 Tax=Empedobacter tilapiae TaxID=2491114 RepID=A0A4Z1BKX1_9FLAO|nr:hypothetical protein [Empedobacter tilapiae]TGN24562.1 hypothetical protein E4J94_13015 [Empedobacter tilapiae]
MKKILLLLPLLILMISCENQNELDEESINQKTNTNLRTNNIDNNLLWNDNGITKRSYIHVNHLNMLTHEKPLQQLSDLSEGDNLGMPTHIWPFKYECSNGNYISSLNESSPSFILITEGYDNINYGKYPGFDIWVQGGWSQNPIDFKIFNNAKALGNKNQLREVGLVFSHWPNNEKKGNHSFKEQFYLGNFNSVFTSFKVKLDDYYPKSNIEIRPTYITADFRFTYYNSEGVAVRSDVIGVLFSNPYNYDFYKNPNDVNHDKIFWKDFDSVIDNVPLKRILLDGKMLNINLPNNSIVSSIFNNVNFDYMPLIKKFLPSPPNGLTYNDAVIIGFDIYSSTRDGDVTFSIKDIRLLGN